MKTTNPACAPNRAPAPQPQRGDTFVWLALLFGVLTYLHDGPPAKNSGDVVSSIAFAACLGWLLLSSITEAVAASRTGRLQRRELIAASASAVALVVLPLVWLVWGLSPVRLFLLAGKWAGAGAVLLLALGLLMFLIAIVGGGKRA